MKTKLFLQTAIVITLTAGLAVTDLSAAPGGKGNGGGDKSDKGSGGSGFNAGPEISVSLIIEFRNDEADGFLSDGYSYVDLEEEVDAHIYTGSGGNYGNLYLHTGNTLNRYLTVDISDCRSNCPDPQPFTREDFHFAGLKVVAADAVSGGVCGMSVGKSITAVAQLTYNFETEDSQPGFIHFQPGIKGKSPCRGANGSDEVLVEKLKDQELGDYWRVSGEMACVTAPGGADPGGTVSMPFSFDAFPLETCN